MKLIVLILTLLFSSPSPLAPAQVSVVPEAQASASEVVYPIDQFAERQTVKEFGTWVDDGRFLGYHLGEDVEYADVEGDVPVRAIADGTVLHAGWVKGYGGMMLVRHEVNGQTVNAIYGHLDPASFAAKEGEAVRKGETIAVLGDAYTHETDGRRKHLHFGLYEGAEKRFNGYTLDVNELATWIDPDAFFRENL